MFFEDMLPDMGMKIMFRDFENDTFVIRALRDIARGEELTHTYKSLHWRSCFSDLR